MDVGFNGPPGSLRKKKKSIRPFSLDRMMWIFLVVLELMLGARFFLALGRVDMANGILHTFGKVSGAVITPYSTLLSVPPLQGSGLEVKTLVAMGVYAVMFWIVISMSTSPATQIESSDR